MAIFLGGGGGAAESIQLDRKFAAAVGEGKVVYWPFAMADDPEVATCEAWLRRAFNPLGLTNIETWTTLRDRDLLTLADAAGLYLGGGNTYRLLHELQTANALSLLRELVASGLHLYGGSAGAAVLGTTIATISHIDADYIGLTDLTGAAVVEAAVWVHYAAGDRPLIEQFLRERGGLVVAIETTGGAMIDGDTVWSHGSTPVRLFTRTSTVEVPGGEFTQLSLAG